MPTLTRADYSIHYEVEGASDAPLLVLSNSLGATLGMWDAQAAEFSKRFRVLRYDNRGHGGSSAPAGAYSIAGVAGDAAALIEQVGAQAAHFCGLSLGGMVGMWLATNRPEMIHKLVLCNTAALMGPRSNWETRIDTVRRDGMAAVVKPVMERWFTPAFREKAEAAERIRRIEQGFLNVSVEGYVGCCAAIRDMDQRKTISGIKAPAMVVAGTFDPSTPPLMGQEIAGLIKGSRYVELPTAHLSNVEAAGTFNDVVGYFLGA